MKFDCYQHLVLADLYRIGGTQTWRAFLRQLVGGSAFKYVFWLRTCQFAHASRILRPTVYVFSRLMLRRLTYRLGISIPWNTRIGSGFYIGHFGGIVVSGGSVIGKNCNISQGVTLGKSNRGAKAGYPVIGDDVYIGPGAKIIGAVNVGNNVAIGANCVVISDVPDDSVVVGVPGRVVSAQGSVGYVNNTDYEYSK